MGRPSYPPTGRLPVRYVSIVVVALALLVGCADPPVTVAVTVTAPIATTTVAHVPAHSAKWWQELDVYLHAVALHDWFVFLASLPQPVSSMRCPPGAIKSMIDKAFEWSAPWAESIAWRESNCTADALNSSGSAGVFQLLGHNDLLRAVCRALDPRRSWAIAYCNILAARRLFSIAGIGPWRL